MQSKYDTYSKEELLGLKHNDHRLAFNGYITQSRHAQFKSTFLESWVKPSQEDFILEFGSSSGKTCIHLALIGGGSVLGIDFDPEAVAIASEMRDRYFPELKERCKFIEGDLETMEFPTGVTKILMPDFTEHIPDRVFTNILKNVGKQLPNVPVYIYTPDGAHIFEILKKRNLILKNPEGHINVKSAKELENFIQRCGWKVESYLWAVSHLKYFSLIEKVVSLLPVVGVLFRRRIAIIMYPQHTDFY